MVSPCLQVYGTCTQTVSTCATAAGPQGSGVPGFKAIQRFRSGGLCHSRCYPQGPLPQHPAVLDKLPPNSALLFFFTVSVVGSTHPKALGAAGLVHKGDWVCDAPQRWFLLHGCFYPASSSIPAAPGSEHKSSSCDMSLFWSGQASVRHRESYLLARSL